MECVNTFLERERRQAFVKAKQLFLFDYLPQLNLREEDDYDYLRLVASTFNNLGVALIRCLTAENVGPIELPASLPL